MQNKELKPLNTKTGIHWKIGKICFMTRFQAIQLRVKKIAHICLHKFSAPFIVRHVLEAHSLHEQFSKYFFYSLPLQIASDSHTYTYEVTF